MVECIGVSRFLLCVIGITLSAYALHVEFSKMHNKDYKAYCDISEHMSCSKVFTSKHGTGFGVVEPLLGKDSPLNVPNSIYGIIFYSLIVLLGLFKSKVAAWINFMFAVSSCAGSVYLGYILFVILHDTCLVCISTYVINACLLIINFITLNRAVASASAKKKKE